MGDFLPARRETERTDSAILHHGSNGRSRLEGWLASPIARGVADVLPDIVRMASRRSQDNGSRSIMPGIVSHNNGASGMTLSEVEVEVDAPFIRRVVIRSASSWSVAPDVLLQNQQRSRRGRFKFAALTAGLLGIAGMAVARRLGISVPLNRLAGGRFRRQLGAGGYTTKPGTLD
jgi:hypothetical protein